MAKMYARVYQFADLRIIQTASSKIYFLYLEHYKLLERSRINFYAKGVKLKDLGKFSFPAKICVRDFRKIW